MNRKWNVIAAPGHSHCLSKGHSRLKVNTKCSPFTHSWKRRTSTPLWLCLKDFVPQAFNTKAIIFLTFQPKYYNKQPLSHPPPYQRLITPLSTLEYLCIKKMSSTSFSSSPPVRTRAVKTPYHKWRAHHVTWMTEGHAQLENASIFSLLIVPSLHKSSGIP